MITFNDLVVSRYPFLIIERDNNEKYLELIYRQTVNKHCQYEFKMTFEDNEFRMCVVEQNYCMSQKEFYQNNEVSIPTKFKTVEEVYNFINYFLNNPK